MPQHQSPVVGIDNMDLDKELSDDGDDYEAAPDSEQEAPSEQDSDDVNTKGDSDHMDIASDEGRSTHSRSTPLNPSPLQGQFLNFESGLEQQQGAPEEHPLKAQEDEDDNEGDTDGGEEGDREVLGEEDEGLWEDEEGDHESAQEPDHESDHQGDRREEGGEIEESNREDVGPTVGDKEPQEGGSKSDGSEDSREHPRVQQSQVRQREASA